jgi:isopenicillin N synthase-like dioxygenase
MRSIALGLDLGEQFFDDKINEQCHNLRLLSYPPIKSSLLEKDGQARAGAHSGTCGIESTRTFTNSSTDYGTLTLLFQDSVRHFDSLSRADRLRVPLSGWRVRGAESTHEIIHSRNSSRKFDHCFEAKLRLIR